MEKKTIIIISSSVKLFCVSLKIGDSILYLKPCLPPPALWFLSVITCSRCSAGSWAIGPTNAAAEHFFNVVKWLQHNLPWCTSEIIKEWSKHYIPICLIRAMLCLYLSSNYFCMHCLHFGLCTDLTAEWASRGTTFFFKRVDRRVISPF